MEADRWIFVEFRTLVVRSAAALLAACLAFAASPGESAPITVPAGLSPGDSYRLVFVTSTTRDATSSDIADYNDFVAGVAASVPELDALGTTWLALASTASVDARVNTGTVPSSVGGGSLGVPIYRLDGLRLAESNDELWSAALENVFRIDEQGNVSSAAGVWTGTAPTGVGSSGSRQLGTANPIYGRVDATDSRWTEWVQDAASESLPLYAISGELVVVPEPGTAWLLSLGLAVLARRRGRGA